MSDEENKIVSLTAHRQKVTEENEPYISITDPELNVTTKIDVEFMDALAKGEIDLFTDERAKLMMKYMMMDFIESIFHSAEEE